MNYGSLFTGGGGADIGAREAGLDLAWGVEYDADIAAVSNRNLGDHVITADILGADPHTFPAVDVLHASPPCPNFSVAKADGEETPQDIAMAEKVAEFVTVLQPQIFTLENVYAYRHSQSWRMIEEALHQAGYWLNVEHVNAADFGVPQTRRRMIVRAVRGGWVPYLPQPVPWVGWYAAIEDILDTLPPSQFAPWQLARIDHIVENTYENHEAVAGFLINSENAGQLWSTGTRGGMSPSMTIGTSSCPRAWLFGNNANVTSGAPSAVDAGAPAQTVRTGSGGRVQRAVLPHGRVVKMTPRALARYQSFPDWYELPESNQLASRIIGNAVPPLLYQRIIEQLASGIE